jgi:hypothetical protein
MTYPEMPGTRAAYLAATCAMNRVQVHISLRRAVAFGPSK